MSWLLSRLSEGSTWAGIAAVLVAVSQAFPSSSAVTVPAAVVSGALGATIKDTGSSK